MVKYLTEYFAVILEKKKFFANRYVFKRVEVHRIPELRCLFTRVHSLEFIHENRFNILTLSLCTLFFAHSMHTP